jgi:hypothetical protein
MGPRSCLVCREMLDPGAGDSLARRCTFTTYDGTWTKWFGVRVGVHVLGWRAVVHVHNSEYGHTST